jgi:cbb3-type cytochrome oxidase maturation protein
MEILYLLIPLSVALAFLIGIAFWWSVASGQFDDLEGPAHRILLDDDGWSDSRVSATSGQPVDLHQSPGNFVPLTSPAWHPERESVARRAGEPKE